MREGPILVTGGSGQLATSLSDAAGARPLVRAGRPDFDFDRPETLASLLGRHAPSMIINAAAYTAVDRAETDADAAARANHDGPAALARYAAAKDIPLIHISTDYVFDGTKGAPYLETDATNPTGVYGTTKLAGEQAVLASGARALILRTSWVYAARGKNFVLTMLNLAEKHDRLRVVADQVGCPTAAPDLADAILGIVDAIRDGGWRDEFRGIFHAAGSGATSWHGLASAAIAEAACLGGRSPPIDAITTADYPTQAHRPADSRLDCGRLAATFGRGLPDWRDALARTVAEIHRLRQADGAARR